MTTRIKNGKFLLPSGITRDVYLYYEDGKITAITPNDLPYDAEIDAKGNFVSPGFIDIHSHGGGGYDFMDGGTEPIVGAANMHLSHGTTAMLPTTLACSTQVLLEFLKDLRQVMTENLSDCCLLGTHLEGPYFCHEQSGAQNPEYIKAPVPAEYEQIMEVGGDIIKRWSFAPELDGAKEFCKTIIENGISPSIAHSNALYDDVKAVYDIGCRTVTHLYSGMSTIVRKNSYRYLGVVESTYLLDDMTAEIIADGCHLPPPLLKLIVKQLDIDAICLVTDSMRGAGMPEGESLLGRKGEAMPCIIEDGVAKLMDRSSFAGSVATADRLIRTMVQMADVSVSDAVKMMTENPARLLGLNDRGQLKEGYVADIVIFDDDIIIKTVIAAGKTI